MDRFYTWDPWRLQSESAMIHKNTTTKKLRICSVQLAYCHKCLLHEVDIKKILEAFSDNIFSQNFEV